MSKVFIKSAQEVDKSHSPWANTTQASFIAGVASLEIKKHSYLVVDKTLIEIYIFVLLQRIHLALMTFLSLLSLSD